MRAKHLRADGFVVVLLGSTELTFAVTGNVRTNYESDELIESRCREGRAVHDLALPADATKHNGGGDVLVAYTDGVNEDRRGNDFFGEDGLAGVLQDRSAPIKGFAEARHGEAESFYDGVARDDMATVAIGVEELEGVVE